jgi:6,7-dimethyl-8-ribityllumazine synthase
VKQKIGLILVKFHQDEVQSMPDEACRAVVEAGMEVVKEAWIPGSMEAPLAAKRLLVQQDVDGLVVLGIIERGETKHGLVTSQAVTHALIDLQLSFMKPIGIGILGPKSFPARLPRACVRPRGPQQWPSTTCSKFSHAQSTLP